MDDIQDFNFILQETFSFHVADVSMWTLPKVCCLLLVPLPSSISVSIVSTENFVNPSECWNDGISKKQLGGGFMMVNISIQPSSPRHHLGGGFNLFFLKFYIPYLGKMIPPNSTIGDISGSFCQV